MKSRMLSVGLIALGAILIIIGVIFDQNQQVLTKAMQICLECVGIG